MKYIKLFENYNLDEIPLEFEIPIMEWVTKVIDQIGIDSKNKTILDSGANGIVIDLGDNTVLKITSDISEAFYSNKLLNIKSPNLVETFLVNNINSPYHYGDLFVIHMEKLYTEHHSIIKNIVESLHLQNPLVSKLNNGILVTPVEVCQFFESKFYSLNKDTILFVFNKWLNIYKECKKHNLPIDDLRSRNIGISSRNKQELVFYDISSIYELRETPINEIIKITIK